MKLGVIVLGIMLLLPGIGWSQDAVPGTPQPPAPAFEPQMPRTPAPPAPPAPPGRELGRWWKNSQIVSQLQLSEAQIEKIEQVFLDHRLKLIDLKADVERNEARLQPLIEADQIDEAKVSAQLDQLLAARGRLEKANIMMMLSIRKVLSVEQWKKLEEIQHRHEGMPMRMRPPGPHSAPAPAPPRPPEPPEL